MNKKDYWTPLRQYLKKIDIRLDESAFVQFQRYLELLQKWSAVINLTTHTTSEEIVSHHLIDSLSMLPFMKQITKLCDVGSGAGLPGIPLAIARPELQVTLVESNQKKCHFLQQVVRSCGLKNVSVISKRVELFHPEQLFDAIITRAYANLAEMLQQTVHLCDNGGLFLAMKAKVLDQEISEVPNNFLLRETVELDVPGFSYRTLYIYTHSN
jgi:16S rRNA (guanine527-N7)-methyltransferase